MLSFDTNPSLTTISVSGDPSGISSANTSFPTSPSPDLSGPFFSVVVILYRPLANNDIRVRRLFRNIIHLYQSVTYSRLQNSGLIAGTKDRSLLSVSLYFLTIPSQHLSVTSKKVCVNIPKRYLQSFFSNSPTKQLLLLLLLGLKHDVLTLKGNFAKQAELISSLIDA